MQFQITIIFMIVQIKGRGIKMENLKNLIIKNEKAQLNKNLVELKELSKNDLESHYYFMRQLTKLRNSQFQKDEISIEKVQELIIKKLTKISDSRIQEKLEKIEIVESSTNEILDLKIVVEWIKSATWGMNPKAYGEVRTDKNYYKVSTSGISGCGYCKLSTATANILNQIPEILKKMYQLKNDNIEKHNHPLLGYGSGYGEIPYFEGGVGVSCHIDILKKLGYKVESIGTKSTDIYFITKEQ